MIEAYEPFCLADPTFFERPERRDDSAERFPQALRPAPPGWSRTERGTSVVLRPNGSELPPQGWKVHVAATPEVAPEVLERTWNHCVRHRIAFKLARSPWAYLVTNLKYADRGASGKLLTLYPCDLVELETLLTELGSELHGCPGPYILSDLRWRSGPLYVRYGGFLERFCSGADGEPVLAVATPDGTLVPDERTPFFRPPPWVTLPAFLATERAASPPHEFPYRVERAVHFSNAGGVYVARDAADAEVVLKEARPWAGLDLAGDDAVVRLRRERAALDRLAGLDFVPAVLGWHSFGGHEFLALEHIAGESLHTAVARRHPLAAAEPTEEDVAAYTTWAVDVVGQVERHLGLLHERGLAYCDLHPRNVLLRPDGRVVLLDFELARDLDDSRPPALGAPGFCTSAVRTGRAADAYALACLRLAVFLPLTPVINRDPAGVDALLDVLAARFPVPRAYVAQIRAVLTQAPVALPVSSGRPTRSLGLPTPADWAAPDLEVVRAAVVTGILETATPERDDRLYPGDVGQFRYGGCGLAFGAAGVLHALAAAGVDPPEEHVDWLVSAAQREPTPRIGLYDGLHGVAYALDQLGRADDALAVLERVAPRTGDLRTGTLFSGLAGAGLSLLHFARRLDDPSLLDQARAIGTLLADAAGAGAGELVPMNRPGLLHGWSGPALLFGRLYEVDGGDAWLDAAGTALRRDAVHASTLPDGRTYLRDSGVVRPFLGAGSAGLGLVLEQYLAHRPDDELAQLRPGLHRACRPELVTEPGLLDGRAGLLHYVSQVDDPEGRIARQQLIDLHVRRLGWHAVPVGAGIGFPGRGLLRLSADLATGAAGVLLALQSSLSPVVTLPLLGRAVQPSTPGRR